MSRFWLIPVLLVCLTTPVMAADDDPLGELLQEDTVTVLSPAQLRAAEVARQRQARITARRRMGLATGRGAAWNDDSLLQNPFIYRIDYGIARRPVAVPFRMHRDLP